MFEPPRMPNQGQGVPSKKYPVKYFVERPDCYWHTWYGFSGPGATRKDVEVRSGYVAGKGQRRLYASYGDKKAFAATVPAFQNELSAEMLIQTQLPQQFLSGNLRDFVRKGKEAVNGVPCDVYEHSFEDPGSKNRVWLDPKTGFPVRIVSYDIDQAGRETPTHVIDHVEVNIPASATGLAFDPPEGYQITHSPQSQTDSLVPVTSGSSGNASVGLWHGFNIDDRAVLLCWYFEPLSASTDGDAKEPMTFLLAGADPCKHVDVATAEGSGHVWKWSLVFPKKRGDRIGGDSLTAVHFVTRTGRMLRMEDMPLRLSEGRLNAILVEIQRLSKTTVAGSPRPFTLETLRAKIAEHQ
jgi:hypothetical protein